ncbi:MAG: hypothetical protein A2046_12035 [Bacteroidetes bacterium GWA2_30_7]|nr:MAG: hypothetical protein A2046_12035 [Bacteroidetes bacterium GWA2_30_7]
MKKLKLLNKVLSGSRNISFDEITSLLYAYGFYLSRTNGSHHIFVHKDVTELINIQNVKGKAKPYQIKQFLELIEKYNLKMED